MITMERRQVRGDGGARDGALIYVDDVLLAVMTRLTDDDIGNDEHVGRWFVEAGLGPCGLLYHNEHPIFDTLDAASAWVASVAAADDRGEVL